MSEHNNKLELLGSAPIPKALMSLGVPIMIGMLINALYNLVDAYFVSGLGKSQMGAISIVFPLGQVVVGLGLMFGNGAASYLSRLLGRGDKDTANKVASTALYSSLLIGAIIILFSTIFLKPRYLLCSCHFAAAYGMGNERNPICPTHCRYNFRSNHAVYGNTSS